MKIKLLFITISFLFFNISASQAIEPINIEKSEQTEIDQEKLYSEFESLFDEFNEECHSRRIGSRSPFINLLVAAMKKSGSSYSNKSSKRSTQECMDYIHNDLSFTFEHYYKHSCRLAFIDNPNEFKSAAQKGQTIAEEYHYDLSRACKKSSKKTKHIFNEWNTALNIWSQLLTDRAEIQINQKENEKIESEKEKIVAQKIAEAKRIKENEEKKLRLIAEANKAELEKQRLIVQQQEVEIEKQRLIVQQQEAEIEKQKLISQKDEIENQKDITTNTKNNSDTQVLEKTKESINNFVEALGFKDIKIGMTKGQIEKLGVCKDIVPALGAHKCYDRLVNLYGSAFKTPLIDKETKLVQIELALGDFDESKYIQYDQLLSKKYKVNSKITEKELEKFNFHQKDEIFNVYEYGKVALKIFRVREGDILLDIVYSGDEAAGMFYSKPKEKLSIDDL